MALIATNIFSKLTKKDKQQLKNFSKKFGKIEVYEYITKALHVEDVVSYILEGFNVKGFVRDSILWDLLKNLVQKLVELSVNRVGKSNNIHFWIKDVEAKPPLNISFPVNENASIPELIISLKQALDKQLKKNFKDGNIVWIAYDIENKKWTAKLL